MEVLLLSFLIGASHCLLALVFSIFRYVDRSARWSSLWAIFHLCYGVAIVLSNAVFPRAPTTQSTLLYSGLVGVASAAFLCGVVAFTGRRVTWRLLAGASVLMGTLIYAFLAGLGASWSLITVSIFSFCYLAGTVVLWPSESFFVKTVSILLLVRAAVNGLNMVFSLYGERVLALTGTLLLNISIGLALLMAALIGYSRRVEATRRELMRANEQLSDIATRLEEKTTDYAEARDRAETANRAKSQFLSNMSHELRTPLNAVIGYAELIQMLMQSGQTAKLSGYVGNILEAGRHLLSIVNDVLDLSRVDFEAIELDRQPIAMSELVDDVVRMVDLAAQEKNQRIERAVEPGLAASVDIRLIRQVLLNVLGNAVKFTPAGGRIRISAARLGDTRVSLRIADSGPGIPPEMHGQVFDRFWQRQDALTRNHDGVGLGLSIAKRFVTLHGGDIRVESPAEGGACFVIDLPIEPVSAMAEAAVPSRERAKVWAGP